MPQLTLRERCETDLPALWRWTHGETAPEWKRWDAPYFHAHDHAPPLTYAAYLERERAAGAPGPHRRVIALGDTCIGDVSRSEEAPAGGGWWELGITIFDPRHWGGGLGREALRQWTAATFADTGAHVLTLTTWSGNERLVRAAARAGYRECARIPEARAWQEQRWDSVKLATLRREWHNAGHDGQDSPGTGL